MDTSKVRNVQLPPISVRDQARHVVQTWAKGLTPDARRHLSDHDFNRLAEQVMFELWSARTANDAPAG